MDIEPVIYTKKAPGLAESKMFNPDSANRKSRIDGIFNILFVKINEKKLSESQKSKLAYKRQKFPGLRLEEVQTRIDRLQSTTNRFERIKIHQIG